LTGGAGQGSAGESASLDADETLALAARAGIHRLRIPTPFLVGRVNCYLIQDEPLTLVDTGPNSGSSLDALQRALAEHDVTIEDLELVVLTHQHMDHVGLLEIIARRSGAEVAAYAPLKAWLHDYSANAIADDEYAQAMMRRHGVPDDLATVLGALSAAFRAYGSSGEVSRPLEPGDRLSLRDRSFEILHRPGHSPSDTLFWDEDHRILFAGDHLLPHISSNPVISRPLGDGTVGARPRPLLDYITSMRATRELGARLVLPGHGDPVLDPVALIDERLRRHDRRARKILRALGSGPLAAHEIAVSLWGNVAVTQAFLTLSEVLGHLDLLIERGGVAELDDGQRSSFQAV
jgi:glyoxylase-like metal-dependent hydrolase (beta-lactamase superfamily II)